MRFYLTDIVFFLITSAPTDFVNHYAKLYPKVRLSAIKSGELHFNKQLLENV